MPSELLLKLLVVEIICGLLSWRSLGGNGGDLHSSSHHRFHNLLYFLLLFLGWTSFLKVNWNNYIEQLKVSAYRILCHVGHTINFIYGSPIKTDIQPQNFVVCLNTYMVMNAPLGAPDLQLLDNSALTFLG